MTHCLASKADLTEWQSIGSNLCNQQLLLDWSGKVNAALQDTAAMAVGCNLHGVGTSCIVYKLAIFRAQALQASLDDMIAVEVSDERNDTLLQGVDDQLPLQRSITGSMHWQ